MSDFVPAMNASDSGFLNSIHGPQSLGGPRRGVESRVGGDLPFSDERSAHGVAEEPDINRLLREVPLPEGLLGRLRRAADKP